MGRATFWIGGAFAAMGLLFAVVGGWLYLEDRSFAESGVRTGGTVIDVVGSRDSDGDYTYRPVVEFHDAAGERRQFVSRVGSNPPRHSPGERVGLIYQPWSPDEAVIDGFFDRFFLPLMFIGLGSLFAAVGGSLFFFLLRRRRIVAQLRSTGLPIQAKLVECYLDRSIRVNGRSPWRVRCEATHPATGRIETFRSDAVWTDPTGQVVGPALRVLVDPARPKRHFVDLSFLDDGAAV
jgi:hypothetical protein